MNIYNVTYPYGQYGIITVITIAVNAFTAQRQIEIKRKRYKKKKFKIESITAADIKGTKVSIASEEDILNWLKMLNNIDDSELITKIHTILNERKC